MSNTVVVPDLLSLPFAVAARLGDDAGFIVSGIGQDGLGVDADSEASVVAQDPEALTETQPGSRLVLHTGGPGGGDREPLVPLPLEHGGDADLPGVDLPGLDADPDGDPELVPA